MFISPHVALLAKSLDTPALDDKHLKHRWEINVLERDPSGGLVGGDLGG